MRPFVVGLAIALATGVGVVALTEPEATLKSASVPKPVGAYRNGRGGTILDTTAGWVTYQIALLGLAHGRRRLMVSVYCDPGMESEAGSTPAHCHGTPPRSMRHESARNPGSKATDAQDGPGQGSRSVIDVAS